MKRTILYFFRLFCCLAAFTFTSCKKTTPDTETQGTVDNAYCEGEFTNIFALINSYAISQQGIKAGVTPSLTVDTSAWPRKITLDFGTTGLADTVNGDGRLRTGKIRVSFDSLWSKIGSIATISLDTYAVAKSSSSPFLQFSATTVKITHTAAATYHYVITGGKCEGNGYTLHWDTDRKITQTGVVATTGNGDDAYSTTSGTSNGIDRNGKSYKTNITFPIVKRTTCAWMEAGRLDLTPDGLSARTIDYGDGTCDSKASLTIDGNVFTFILN
jgi:hypothetical protein